MNQYWLRLRAEDEGSALDLYYSPIAQLCWQ